MTDTDNNLSVKYCPHGYPLRYSLNCEGCIDGDPDYVIPESELPATDWSDVLIETPRFERDPFREKVLLALATADLQRWTAEELTHYTNRHMAEMMYGKQADAMIELFNDTFTARYDEGTEE